MKPSEFITITFFALLLISCSKDDSEVLPPQPQEATRWECIWFGSYPANEVVSGNFNAVDDYRGKSFWFMRTNGYTPSNITYVCDFGYLYNQGTAITCDDAAVLPAITIDLSKANYQPATPVASTDINH